VEPPTGVRKSVGRQRPKPYERFAPGVSLGPFSGLAELRVRLGHGIVLVESYVMKMLFSSPIKKSLTSSARSLIESVSPAKSAARSAHRNPKALAYYPEAFGFKNTDDYRTASVLFVSRSRARLREPRAGSLRHDLAGPSLAREDPQVGVQFKHGPFPSPTLTTRNIGTERCRW